MRSVQVCMIIELKFFIFISLYQVALDYRKAKKCKLQRTFVSASTAAEDRARGVKRKGGIITEDAPQKSLKIDFVPQGLNETSKDDSDNEVQVLNGNNKSEFNIESEKKSSEIIGLSSYLNEMTNVLCIDLTKFHEGMFQTPFGKMVLLVRPWTTKFSNIQCELLLVTNMTIY